MDPLIIGIALVVFAAVALFMLQKRSDIAGSEARALVDKGATLVDVRSAGEFASGHVEGATNIPVGELASRLDELPSDKPVVVYCASGIRSARAKALLVARGYAEVHNLGPMSAW